MNRPRPLNVSANTLGAPLPPSSGRSNTLLTRQRLSRLNGRDSTISTRSPIWHWLVSSCTFTLARRRRILLVLRMDNHPFNGNHHGLLHPVADDDSAAFFSKAPIFHFSALQAWSAFSRRIVSRRAKSRLVSLSFIGFSNRLVARFSFKWPIASRKPALLRARSSDAHLPKLLSFHGPAPSFYRDRRNRQLMCG